MDPELQHPVWSIKDVAIALAIIFAGSYGLEIVLRPVLLSAFSLAERFLFAGLLQTFFFVGSVFAITIIRYKGNLRQLGLGKISSVSQIKKGVVGGVGLFVLVFLTGIMVSTLIPAEPKIQPFAELLKNADSPFEVFVPFLIGGLFAPLGEEIYFRGFAYPVFKKKLGTIGGIILTAVFFSALHFDLVRFVPIAIGGAGLAWLYETTGSLVTPIIAHSLWNIFMLGLLFLAYQLPVYF